MNWVKVLKNFPTTIIFLKKKYLKMKKKNELLQNKLVISKEKEILSSTLEKTQKDFDAHKISCKAKFSIIDENEISLMKIKIF